MKCLLIPDDDLCSHDSIARRLSTTIDKYIAEGEPLLCNCRAFRLVDFSLTRSDKHLGMTKSLPSLISRRADDSGFHGRESFTVLGRRS